MDNENPPTPPSEDAAKGAPPAAAPDQNVAPVKTQPPGKSRRPSETLRDLRVLIPLTDFRDDRTDEWKKHVEMYSKIGSVPNPPPLGTARIRFVAGHLDILDRKFGILVTFHGLMATIATLYLNFALPHPIRHLPPWFTAFAGVWLLTTMICLRGMAWVRWGDLGWATDTSTAEGEHVEGLIRSVVSRTAWLRLAVPLTFFGIFLLFAAVWKENRRAVVSYSRSKPIATVGPFSSGVACSTRSVLEDRVQEAVSKIQSNNVSALRIVGMSDAMPIGDAQSGDFGNNVGMALARARCVAGWLTDALGTHNIHVEMTVSVQDATDRSSGARRGGAPADRIVQIFPADPHQ